MPPRSKKPCTTVRGRAETAVVYTTCCPRMTPDMLCYKLAELISSKPDAVVDAYLSGANVRQGRVKDIEDIVRKDARHVAKEFQGRSWKSFFNRENFNKEYAGLLDIAKVYRGNENMTALPKLRFKNSVLYGISIYNGLFSRTTYIVFNEKGACDLSKCAMSRKDIVAMIADIGESLHVLHGRNFIHGDLKPANVMRFATSTPYRLIDWGKSKCVRDFDASFDYYGSERTGSPISFYFSRYARLSVGTGRSGFATSRLEKVAKDEIRMLSGDEEFREMYRSAMEQFAGVLGGSDADADVFRAWRFNIDLFGLGMTILFLMRRSNVACPTMRLLARDLLTGRNIKDFMPRVRALCSLKKAAPASA